MKIIAHRGGPLIAETSLPENSLAAIQRALDLGIKSIEIDVIASCGKLWISHDRRLGRTISGKGVIANLPLEYLQQQALANGEPIPQLPAILALVKNKAELNIEIKGQNTIQPVIECLQAWIVEQQLDWEQFNVSSFDHQQLYQSLQLMPQLRRGVLIEGVPIDYAGVCRSLKAFSLNSHLGFFTKDLLSDAKRHGVENWVYTVNYRDDAEWLKTLGADAIFTDKPDLMLGL
jgi:glycerophosphoryl diester phosphodiesterase